MARDKQSTKSIGDNLEKLVLAYYEALGYRVVRNSNIAGHQIDLVASKYVSGAGHISLMVEVKSRQRSSVGIGEVTPFLNTASALLLAGQIHGAIIVTDSEFTQDARAAASVKNGIRLATIRDLEQDLFNYSESLMKIRYDYESKKIFEEYIALAGELQESHSPVNDIAKYIQGWATKSKPLLVLVGDFGSGKTTVMERIFYRQAVARLSRDNILYPVFFRLRNLLQYPDLWSFVLASLRDNNHISPTQRMFEAQLVGGQLLILLDGFDEIDTGAGADDRAKYLKRLAPILGAGSPAVLSTRPTYFESFDDMSRAFNASFEKFPSFARLDRVKSKLPDLMGRLNLSSSKRLPISALRNIVVVSQLSDKKIAEYLTTQKDELKRVTGATVEEVRRFLYRVYDLEDLMKRPLLLSMITETILGGMIDVSNPSLNIGPSTLYDMYTQFSAKRDVDNRPVSQFLTQAERLRACREIAMLMLKNDTIVLKGAEILNAIDRAGLASIVGLPKHAQQEGLDRALTDIRVCTFLMFSDDGSLRFAHKSYWEFFVAQSLVVEAQGGPLAFIKFSELRLTREIIYFMGSFARDQETFGAMILNNIREREAEAGRLSSLLHRIAFASGVLLENRTFANTLIEAVDLRRADAGNVVIANSRLVSVSVRDLTARAWDIENCELLEATLSRSRVLESKISVNANRSEFEDCEFDRCDTRIRGEGWFLKRSRFYEGNVRLGGFGRVLVGVFQGCEEVKIESAVRIAAGADMTFSGCAILADIPQAQFPQPPKGQRSGVPTSNRILKAPLSRWYDVGAKLRFESCELGGVWIELPDVVALAEDRSSRSGGVSIESCRGVVVFLDDQEALDERGKAKLRKDYPDVVFCDVVALKGAIDLREEGRKRVQKEAQMKKKKLGEERAEPRIPLLDAVRMALGSRKLIGKVGGLLNEAMRT